ncbi:hypothetical protein SEA_NECROPHOXINUS_125 [Microbacterium phage Necrophoxinus]|nr:membrane protein [Microbacterium phage Necrophoxinus]QWS69486.1 hypothetical protein SEA_NECROPHOXINUS_125 [Microbacterium phage Necrophoxinus]
MHAESDSTGYYAALSRLTGHSVRYLRIRAAVRAVVAIVPISAAYAYALSLTP